jgi:quercetin dioxygenase-like cupin family protein
MQSHSLSRILDRIGDQSHGGVLDLADGAATVEFLTPPNRHDPFCVIRGVVAPGAIVPLHSHDDTEAFFVISGSIRVLTKGAAGLEWHPVTAGDYVHVESGTAHTWRNDSREPAVLLIATTKRMGEFFQEVGRSAGGAPQPPSPEDLAQFASVAVRYGYWLAIPEDNAAVGIELPLPVGADH